MKPTLRALAERYGCDKLYSHSYVDFYEELFKGRDVKRLLEVGIGFKDLMDPFVPFHVQGASLWMWYERFPEAEIYACDIREDALIQASRITSMLCDQSKREDLERMASAWAPWDVVIDDGSHQHEHQLLTAQVLLPHVTQGGVYVVEDVWPDKGAELAKAIGGELWKGSKRGDDNLVVVRKGAVRTSY